MLAVLFASPAPAGAKQFVMTPTVAWEALVPYIRSHVVPQIEEGEFHVYVCATQVDRDVVTPYDEVLGDFAKVLLFDGLRHDRRIERAVATTTEEFRDGLGALDEAQRMSFREVFWNDLAVHPEFLPRLRARFEIARRDGRVRCWMCEHEPSFRPRGLQGGEAG